MCDSCGLSAVPRKLKLKENINIVWADNYHLSIICYMHFQLIQFICNDDNMNWNLMYVSIALHILSILNVRCWIKWNQNIHPRGISIFIFKRRGCNWIQCCENIFAWLYAKNYRLSLSTGSRTYALHHIYLRSWDYWLEFAKMNLKKYLRCKPPNHGTTHSTAYENK